jgi:hypothetical protein
MAERGPIVEEKLGTVGRRGGNARGDAVGGDEHEHSAQELLNVDGSMGAGIERGELGADVVQVVVAPLAGEVLMFAPGMVGAEGGMGLRAEHAAGAAVREWELAEEVFVDGVRRSALRRGAQGEASLQMSRKNAQFMATRVTEMVSQVKVSIFVGTFWADLATRKTNRRDTNSDSRKRAVPSGAKTQ